MSRFLSTVAALAIPATLSVGMVHADGFIDEAGGASRINYSGKLRMLSQRIPAAACNEAAGIAYDVSAALLESSVAEFDQIIAGLEHGDDALGMFGAEQDRKVLADIQAVHAIWDPLHVDLDAMIGGEVTVEHAEVIEHASFELLEIAVHITALVTAEYANPTELMQADAIIIDIAGRQRMLAQKISKDACMIATGVDVEEASAELVGAIDTYAVSLSALQNGLPEAGITPPPTEEITAGLAEVAAQWSALQPILASIKAGNSASDEDRATLFLGMNSLTGQMNTVVGQYAEASKLGL